MVILWHSGDGEKRFRILVSAYSFLSSSKVYNNVEELVVVFVDEEGDEDESSTPLTICSNSSTIVSPMDRGVVVVMGAVVELAVVRPASSVIRAIREEIGRNADDVVDVVEVDPSLAPRM